MHIQYIFLNLNIILYMRILPPPLYAQNLFDRTVSGSLRRVSYKIEARYTGRGTSTVVIVHMYTLLTITNAICSTLKYHTMYLYTCSPVLYFILHVLFVLCTSSSVHNFV